jgi:hypothetical protein
MRVVWHQFPAWLLLATLPIATSSIAASSARFVPGEVIVHFASGSEGHRIVTQMTKQPAPDLMDVAPVVAHLETMTNIPLTAKQLLSGQRLLLEVDTNRIIPEVSSQLRRKPGVLTASPDQTPAEPSQPPSAGSAIRIEFAQDSPLNHRLAEAADNLDSPTRQRLLADLQRGLAIPLTIRAVHRETLLLDVDLPALTHLTIQRLSTLSEVHNAQLNYLLSIRTPER